MGSYRRECSQRPQSDGSDDAISRLKGVELPGSFEQMDGEFDEVGGHQSGMIGAECVIYKKEFEQHVALHVAESKPAHPLAIHNLQPALTQPHRGVGIVVECGEVELGERRVGVREETRDCRVSAHRDCVVARGTFYYHHEHADALSGQLHVGIRA